MLACGCLGPSFSRHLLIAFGLLSLFLAAPMILVQKNLKRMLAYSSLEHVGLICTGIGLNTPLTIFGALLHMGYHALTKPVLFFAAGNVHQAYHTVEFRRIGSGLAKTLPVTAVLLGVAATAAAGLPPFGLFYSELTIVGGGIAAHQVLVSILVMAAIIASFCGLLQQLTRIMLGVPKTSEAGILPIHGGSPEVSFCPAAANRWDGLPAMVLMLGGLLCFSLWRPRPIRQLLFEATGLIAGKPM
jgi:hydrogenase-4 component F